MQTRERARIGSRLTAATLAAVAALALASSAGAQQERIAIRGTSVTLTPPPGFTPSRSAAGVENTATGSTITISEQARETYADLAERFSSAKSLTDGYAQQKVTIRGVRRIDGKIPFAIGRQLTSGKDVRQISRAAARRQDGARDVHDRRPQFHRGRRRSRRALDRADARAHDRGAAGRAAVHVPRRRAVCRGRGHPAPSRDGSKSRATPRNPPS